MYFQNITNGTWPGNMVHFDLATLPLDGSMAGAISGPFVVRAAAWGCGVARLWLGCGGLDADADGAPACSCAAHSCRQRPAPSRAC
jgi:hypothetical protein